MNPNFVYTSLVSFVFNISFIFNFYIIIYLDFMFCLLYCMLDSHLVRFSLIKQFYD